MKNKTLGLTLMALSTIAALVAVYVSPPLAQDTAYHQFQDQRHFFSIPNFFNVVSNVAFLFVGGWGLRWLYRANAQQYLTSFKSAYGIFFFGVSCVAFGSAYYHWEPSNESLLWDRLPMAIAFMSLFAILLSEFIAVQIGKGLLLPLLGLGLSSVLYWHYTELQGAGDLRFYILVQFLPMLLVPILLSCFQPRFSLPQGYWQLLGVYILAKICEHFDAAIFALLPLSGHTLKHLLAAYAIFLLLQSYQHRQLVSHP